MTSRLTSEVRMPSQPIVMPSEIETVLNSSGVPPASRMPVLHVHGQLAQVIVAGTDLDPGVGDADERLPQILSVRPVARSIARAGARLAPSVNAALRHFRGWLVDIRTTGEPVTGDWRMKPASDRTEAFIHRFAGHRSPVSP